MRAPSLRARATYSSTFFRCFSAAIGPMTVAGSRGSPIGTPGTASARMPSSVGYTERATSRRGPPMQNWPVLKTKPLMTAPTAFSRSASSKTMWAAFPPSSMVTGLSASPATLATCRPIAVEPVKATLSTPRWRSSASPATGPLPVTTLTTPSGRPPPGRAGPCTGR